MLCIEISICKRKRLYAEVFAVFCILYGYFLVYFYALFSRNIAANDTAGIMYFICLWHI